MKLLVQWLVRTLILLLVTYIVPGFRIDSIGAALLAVIVLAVLNMLIKPVLLLLTLPINIVTLGLFTFVINALMLYAASAIVRGFHINSFGTALFAALVMAVLSAILNRS